MFFQINIGVVQPYIVDVDSSDNFYHFGRAEYDKNKSVLSETDRKKAQDVCDALNDNELTYKDAQKILDKI